MKVCICDRCGCDVSGRITFDKLYSHTFTDCLGEKAEMKLCWDCDWDISNGGDPFEDHMDISFRRAEEAYAYDPINNPRPY